MMNIYRCFILTIPKVAKFQSARIKRQVNAFLICLAEDDAVLHYVISNIANLGKYLGFSKVIFKKFKNIPNFCNSVNHHGISTGASAIAKLGIYPQMTIVLFVHFQIIDILSTSYMCQN